MRDTVAGACLCSLMLTLASTSASYTAAARHGVPATPVDVASLRVVRARQYRMAGGVRPLLFWINRDDIGLARITWRAGDAGAFGYEFLVGTDPIKAPRGLNRWGYIAEDTRGAEASLLALMTGADEASYDEAASNAAQPAGVTDFRAIRSSLIDGTSTWQTARVASPTLLTVHDVEAALDNVRRDVDAARRRDRQVPAGMRGGFLTAAATLIDAAVRGINANESQASIAARRVQYVFGQGGYELSFRAVETGRETVDGKAVPVVRTSFEIRTLATGARTRFDVTSGRDGDLCGVPIEIAWQPRWWLRVSLRLEGSS